MRQAAEVIRLAERMAGGALKGACREEGDNDERTRDSGTSAGPVGTGADP